MRGERSTGAPTKDGEKANKRKIKIKGVNKTIRRVKKEKRRQGKSNGKAREEQEAGKNEKTRN